MAVGLVLFSAHETGEAHEHADGSHAHGAEHHHHGAETHDHAHMEGDETDVDGHVGAHADEEHRMRREGIPLSVDNPFLEMKLMNIYKH